MIERRIGPVDILHLVTGCLNRHALMYRGHQDGSLKRYFLPPQYGRRLIDSRFFPISLDSIKTNKALTLNVLYANSFKKESHSFLLGEENDER